MLHLFLLLVPFLLQNALAFHPSTLHNARTSSLLYMAPRFDPSTQKWFPTSPSEEPSAGYSPIGTLIRQGPPSFFQRIIKPDLYEQSVLKFMAQEGCSRKEAQGNMDAYLANPSDWAFQRYEEQRTGVKKDYGKDPEVKELTLTGLWALVVFGLLGRIIYVASVGGSIYSSGGIGGI